LAALGIISAITVVAGQIGELRDFMTSIVVVLMLCTWVEGRRAHRYYPPSPIDPSVAPKGPTTVVVR
jgi:hypothetical protein